MRHFIIGLALLVTSSFANATSLHPCTPTVELMAMHLSCKQGNVDATIVVRTWTSPRTATCQGKNYFENQLASVEFSTGQETLVKLSISGPDFKLKAEANRTFTFSSEKYSIDLKDCEMPVHGGISIGN